MIRLRQHYAAAQSLYEESLSLQREVNDRRGAAHSLFNLGNVAVYRDDYSAALEWYEQSLPLFQEIGDRDGIANVLNNLGEVARLQGDYAAADTWLKKALVLYRDLGDKNNISIALEAAALLASEQKHLHCRAALLFGAAMALRKKIGAPLRPIDQPEHEATLTALRAALGEATFSQAFDAGHALAWEEAVAYVLEPALAP
jgi:tetratricopeptide (TPR) repeat protein